MAELQTPKFNWVEMFIFKVVRNIFRRFALLFGFAHSIRMDPFICGDTFRSLADHIYDETTKVDPLSIRFGDVVFVSQETIPEFFTKIAWQAKHRFIVITHNGDRPNFNEDVVNMMPDIIYHCFAQSALVNHTRVTPLPAAIESLRYFNSGFVVRFFSKFLVSKNKKKLSRIFYLFNPQTNPVERLPALEYAQKNPLCDTFVDWVSALRHAVTLSKYKFVLSPAGNGPDGHRTWEALYLRTVPILKNSVFARYHKEHGLPILIINDWTDLDRYTENELKDTYEALMREADFSQLHISYWQKKINAKQLELQDQVERIKSNLS